MSLHPNDFLMIASSNSTSSPPFSPLLFLNFLLQLRTPNKTLLLFVHTTQFLTPTIFFTYMIMISDPKRPSSPIGTRGLQSRVPWACVSSCRARESVLWEKLPSKRVTAGPRTPYRSVIGNPRTAPVVPACQFRAVIRMGAKIAIHRGITAKPLSQKTQPQKTPLRSQCVTSQHRGRESLSGTHPIPL